MTPETLPIDTIIRGVGRIHRASGTTDKVVRRNIVRMLRRLREAGRLDILRAIRDGKISFLQVYDAYQRQSLHELPVGNTMPLLVDALAEWIADVAGDISDDHAENHETARRYIERHDKTARVADLPRVLEALRKSLGAKHPRSFNLVRASALSFARATLKRSHPIYIACVAVEVRPVPRRAAKPQLTPEVMRGFFPTPDAATKEGKVDRIAWALVTTGMGAKEYWGAWEIRADRVHIHGTKRGGRVRDIPLVRAPALPPLSRDRFERLFRERMKKRITPYDLRRTYAQWLESAGIPRTRRRMYMGHGSKDVGDLYERHEVTAFLVADAKTLGAYLGITPPEAVATVAPMLGVVK